MICAYLVRPIALNESLFIDRKDQLKISLDFELYLGYMPFIYNSSQGMYFFIDKNDCNKLVERWVCNNIEAFTQVPFEIIATHYNTHYFQEIINAHLTDQKISALAWKRTISSFLTQLKPFQGDTKSVYNLFLYFVEIIKKSGNKSQLEYLKHKMNQLRTRVTIHSDTFG